MGAAGASAGVISGVQTATTVNSISTASHYAREAEVAGGVDPNTDDDGEVGYLSPGKLTSLSTGSRKLSEQEAQDLAFFNT